MEVPVCSPGCIRRVLRTRQYDMQVSMQALTRRQIHPAAGVHSARSVPFPSLDLPYIIHHHKQSAKLIDNRHIRLRSNEARRIITFPAYPVPHSLCWLSRGTEHDIMA